MTLLALLFSITVSAASLAWGFAERGFTTLGMWIAALGVMWIIAAWQNLDWASALGLLAAVSMSALGLWFRFAPGWMLASAIFALLAWDMTDFRSRLVFMPHDDNTRSAERRHIARASLLAFAGLALASIAMLAVRKFTLEWAALLSTVTMFTLAQLTGWFKKS